MQLAEKIPWSSLAESFEPLYCADNGRPAVSIRLMAGLHLLKHTYALSDEEVVARWKENPYWQFFCGEEFFQHELPIHPTQMTRWRQRIGEAGCERLLQLTIEAGQATGTISERSMEKVVVDTTVQPKAIAYPTDARLYAKAHRRMVSLAKKHGIVLRQSFTRTAKHAAFRHGGYAKAKQFKRAKKEVRTLRVIAGRVRRDIGRKLEAQPNAQAEAEFAALLPLVDRLLTQKRKDKGKLYALHAPEVECLAKGKAHKPYEFGVKTSLATTLKEGFCLGMQACPGNPYDGHTLAAQLDQVKRLTGKSPKRVMVDKGYRGHGVDPSRCQVIISGRRRGKTASEIKDMRRRSSIEPNIGHQKSDGLLGRNFLKGGLGDAQNALLCGTGHNMRKILAHLRRLFVYLWAWLTALLVPLEDGSAPAYGAA